MVLMSNMGEYQTNESPGRVMWEHLQYNKPWETWFFQRGEDELFTGGWVGYCWVPNRDDARLREKCMPRCNALKNWRLPDRKGWALYWSVSELLLSPKEGWHRMKWKLYAEVQRPEKRASSWELFTGGWVSWWWVPKRDDAENEKESINIFLDAT